MTTAKCEKCGKRYRIGDWPFCRGGHGRPSKDLLKPFIPYFDISIGEYIHSHGQRMRLMRQKRLDYAGVAVGDPGCMI